MDSCGPIAGAVGTATAQIYLASGDAGSISDDQSRDAWRARSSGAAERRNGFVRLRGNSARKAWRFEHRAAARKLRPAYGIARSTGVPRNRRILWRHETLDGTARPLLRAWRLRT